MGLKRFCHSSRAARSSKRRGSKSPISSSCPRIRQTRSPSYEPKSTMYLKRKIVRTNRQSNLRASCQSIFSLPRHYPTILLGWRQDNRNRPNQESKFDFLTTRQQLGKIDGGQQKIKIVRTNRQSNLRGSCQSIFSLCRHHPTILYVQIQKNSKEKKSSLQPTIKS